MNSQENLSYYSSYGDSQGIPIPEPTGEFTSIDFSTCGQLLAAGTDKGRVFIFPILYQNQLLSRTHLCPALSFNVPQAKFDLNRGIFTSSSINSIQFSPEYQLNPKLLISTSHTTHLYQIVRDSSFKYILPNNSKNSNLQNFECPQIQSPSIQYKSDHLYAFDDIRLNEIINSDFYCPTSFFVTASNAACIFDVNKKNGLNEATMLSYIPGNNINANTNANNNVSTINSDASSKSVNKIVCSDFNKQFQEMFLLGMSDGTLSLFDMRQQPENLTPSFTINTQQFVQKDHRDSFTDVKSVKFAPNNLFFAARTFGDLMIYDIRKPNETYAQLDIQWFKRMDSVVLTGMGSDKFGLEFIDDIRLIAGAYDETMILWDFKNLVSEKVQLNVNNTKKDSNHFLNQVNCIKLNSIADLIAATSKESVYFYKINYDSTILQIKQNLSLSC